MAIEINTKQKPRISKREPLYLELFEAVKQRIEKGHLMPGTKAPSESDLIAEFHVSSTTARRCLNELEQAGYVDRMQGRGTFVRPPSPLTPCRQIGVLYNELISLTDIFSSQLLKGIGLGMEQSEFHPLLMASGMLKRSLDPSAALRELVRRQDVEGLIIMSPLPQSWLEPVLDEGMAVMAINFGYDDPRIGRVVGDTSRAMRWLADRLVEHGHRQVTLLRRTFPEDLTQGVRLAVMSLSQLDQIEWNLREFPYFQQDQTKDIVRQSMEGPQRPTAFVAYGYELALETRDAIRSMGLSCPEDVSLLFTGVPPGRTDISGEIIPVEQMSEWAVQALMKRLDSTKNAETWPPAAKEFPNRSNPGLTLALAKSSLSL
ncbi:MAG: GntR family transcriptional regulator [Phycisphaerales bacterium]|nr:GntR family transcriptional regulator [Phycisphaerales bacterium]